MSDKKSVRKAATKVTDYKTLHEQGMTSSVDSGDEMDRSIAFLSSEVDKLALEEKQVELMLVIAGKKKNIEKMSREIQSQQESIYPNQQSPPSTTVTFPQPHSDLPSLATLRMDLDPQVYLRQPGKVKYKRIIDFIPRHSREDEEFDLANGLSIKMKTGQKLKIEQVSPSQWIVANACILAEVIKERPGDQNLVLDYLSYNAKIGEFASRFTWASVMSFDDEYRYRQALYNFRWGSDSPHTSQIILKEREKSTNQDKKKSNGKPFAKSPGQDKLYCFEYNLGKHCQYGKDCRYQHICESCDGNHAKINHNRNQSAEPAKKNDQD